MPTRLLDHYHCVSLVIAVIKAAFQMLDVAASEVQRCAYVRISTMHASLRNKSPDAPNHACIATAEI